MSVTPGPARERTNPLDAVFVVAATLLILAITAPLLVGVGYGWGLRADGALGDRYLEGATEMCRMIAAQADVPAQEIGPLCAQLAGELP